jgi:ABC-2 type transport system ATP-binding protein
MSAIELHQVGKRFTVRAEGHGARGAFRHLLGGASRDIEAVRDVSFSVEPAERVAFIGPNGAGKSTTIKILCGILHPSEGEARVLGYVPWKERRALSYQIGTVFGQRSRLWFHLPVRDTFDLLARVYDLDLPDYRRRLAELVDGFAIEKLIDRPVRQLSLGERMRCEIVAALLHRPRVLFLDEPTIGLDVVAKASLRELVLETARRDGTTILLTSHDTADMERVCQRAIVIHEGRLLLDQDVASLRSTFIRRKVVTVLSEEETVEVTLPGVTAAAATSHRTILQVETDVTPIEVVMQAVLASCHVQDITVEDPPMDDVVTAIYGTVDVPRTAESVR